MNYPNLIIHLDYIKENAKAVADACRDSNISVCGIVKGLHSDPSVARAMLDGGVSQIGDARIGNLKRLKDAGIEAPRLLTRIPMPSEVGEMIKVADISLNSELETIQAINTACLQEGTSHKVVLMYDLGDLREGFISKAELLQTALQVEAMEGVKLGGVGTNLGCYGSIKPTHENLSDLVQMARTIEDKIGRKLEIVSGGATSSLPLVYEEDIPEGINHLRIGEAILLARDLPDIWKVPMPGTHQDTVLIEAQIVELKRKPSYPIGEIFIDAFGNTPTYEDRGWETRAILALGRQDFAMVDQLIPRQEGIRIVGCSSDHLIISIEDNTQDNIKEGKEEESAGSYKVGDVVQFEMFYGPMLFLSGAEHIQKTYL